MIKKCSNPTSAISDETIVNQNAQIVGDDIVRVLVPSPESTTQTLPSFEENTSPVTYPDEVEETIGILMEVEPLDELQLEDLGLNACNHDIPLSSSLGDERGPEPPIKPHSLDSSRMKVVDYLTSQTPYSPHVANSHPKGVYIYYNPGMIEDDWKLESKEVSLLGRGLNSPVRPKELEKVRIKETHHLEHVLLENIGDNVQLKFNGDSPPPKKTVDGVEQIYPPITAEEKLARKNELKARGTLLMALPNEHQLKFNTYKSAKSLMEAIEKRFGGNKESKKIDADDLEEIDLKWQMAILTMRAKRFLNKTGRKVGANGSKTIGFNKAKCDGLGYDWSDNAAEGPINFALMAYTSSGSSSSLSSDSEVSTCSKACLKYYETLKEHYDNLTKDFNKSQTNVGAYKAGLESVKARLDVYKKNEAVFEEDIKILKLDVMLRDNALTELRKKFKKAEKERDDLKLTLEKFESSSKNLSKLLEIQVSDKFKTGVRFDSQVFDSQVNDKYKTSETYHAVPPPYTGNFMPPKHDLVL
ncbi:hypothetical protein Tco_1018263 [Tanacetum coccineum]|uniref:Uncharacterized protein n=1 Tax=Tanacetum coccineum TaxID=301880 RepID=A0ABQ5FV92_9ASTR